MEENSGVRMVDAVRRDRVLRSAVIPQRLSTTVKLSEVFAAGLRLEAGAFSIEARNAIKSMRASGLPLIPLYGPNGLCREAHNAFRFVRTYVSPDKGVPFLSSADIINMRADTDYFLSKKVTKRLDELIIRNWDVLISCSGTIGNVALASAGITGKALSQDAIRLRTGDAVTAGYITAFLRCRFGRLQLIQATYGSIIKHIEPAHLERVLVPEMPAHRNEIGQRVKHAYQLRDEANRLLDDADSALHDLLNLPYLSKLPAQSEGPVILKLRASALAKRFEASYHDPSAQWAEAVLKKPNDRLRLVSSYMEARNLTKTTRKLNF